ncbi:MAG: hypothetical protein ACR2OJ_17075, partial [Hyphomicrobiales bacterium]
MRRQHFLRILAAFLFLITAELGVNAQTLIPGSDVGSNSSESVKLPEPLTQEAVRELVSKLSDTEVRQLLLDRLDAVAKDQKASGGVNEASLLNFVSAAGRAVVDNVYEDILNLPQMLSGQFKSFR